MSTRVTPNAAGTGHEPTSAFVMIDPATGGLVPAPTRGSGALDAGTQRVALATDSPGVASLASIESKTPALVNGATPVGATPRVCLGNFTLTIATGSAVSLLQAIQAASAGAIIPAGAVVVELQPKNGAINVSRFAGTTPTATIGLQVDTLVNQVIDSSLVDVKLVAISSSVTVNCSFFDRV